MIKLNKRNRRILWKIAEEAGELVTAVAKLLLWRDKAAWQNFQEETVDLLATLTAFSDYNPGTLNADHNERFKVKFKKIKEQVEQ